MPTYHVAPDRLEVSSAKRFYSPAPEVHGSYIRLQVSFLVGVDALVTKLIDFSGIARSVFLDLIAPDCHLGRF